MQLRARGEIAARRPGGRRIAEGAPQQNLAQPGNLRNVARDARLVARSGKPFSLVSPRRQVALIRSRSPSSKR
jgi:hypothetical protein